MPISFMHTKQLIRTTISQLKALHPGEITLINRVITNNLATGATTNVETSKIIRKAIRLPEKTSLHLKATSFGQFQGLLEQNLRSIIIDVRDLGSFSLSMETICKIGTEEFDLKAIKEMDFKLGYIIGVQSSE